MPSQRRLLGFRDDPGQAWVALEESEATRTRAPSSHRRKRGVRPEALQITFGSAILDQPGMNCEGRVRPARTGLSGALNPRSNAMDSIQSMSNHGLAR